MATQEENQEKVGEGTKDGKQKIAVGEKRKADSEGKLDSAPIKAMKIGKKTTKNTAPSGISIKVGPMKSTEVQKKKADIMSIPKKGSVAAAFNEESDDEEEIPKEAKMRMRNLGKDTATSSGPNSFNKGKQGFTNFGKLLEKQIKHD